MPILLFFCIVSKNTILTTTTTNTIHYHRERASLEAREYERNASSSGHRRSLLGDYPVQVDPRQVAYSALDRRYHRDYPEPVCM